VAVAPAKFVAYELDMSQNRTNQPDWEAQMAAGIVPEMNKLVSASGGRILGPKDVESYALFGSFHAWGTTAAMEITAQMYGRADHGTKSIGDWRFDENLTTLREALDADFVMVVVFREAFETDGRAIASMIGGMQTHWKQVGVVCIADLRDGRMVWCVAGVDRWHDLRRPNNGQYAVQQLLGPILGASLISKYGTPRPEPVGPATNR
jgi:hypothetical protein